MKLVRLRLVTFAVSAAALVAALPSTATSADLRPPIPVRGRIVSRLLTGPACQSPIDICTQGRITGPVLEGDFVFTAKSLTPSADTPVTGVMHYTGEILIKTRTGTISIKDAGAINWTKDGTGDVGAVSTITGGTGRHIGLTGRLRIAGMFTPAQGGLSEYHGYVVLP